MKTKERGEKKREHPVGTGGKVISCSTANITLLNSSPGPGTKLRLGGDLLSIGKGSYTH